MSGDAFATIIAGFGEARLRTHMAEERLLHVKAPRGIDAQALLSRNALDRAFGERRVRPDIFRLFAGYRSVNPEALGAIDAEGLNPQVLRQLAGQRATFLINRLDEAMPHLFDFACAAERVLGDHVSLVAIASFGTETGLAAHADAHGLILVQTEGSKRWRFFEERAPASKRRSGGGTWDQAAPVAAELVMEPGDLLYVPPGLAHECAPGDYSLHLGVLIDHQYGAAILSRLIDAMRGDPVLASGNADERKARMLALAKAIDAPALFAEAARRRMRQKPPRDHIKLSG